MFGEDRSQSPRMPSPWTSRLSTSLDPSPLAVPETHRRAQRTQAHHSPSLAPLNPEEDTIGNIEYKLKLLPPTRDRFNRLVTQLKWRLLQGGGMAIYEVGVLDDGALVGLSRREMRASLDTLERMAAHLGARVEVRRVIVVQRYPGHDPATTTTTTTTSSSSSSSTPPTQPASRPSSSLPDFPPHLSLPSTSINGVHTGALPPSSSSSSSSHSHSHSPSNPAAPQVISDRIPRTQQTPTDTPPSPSHQPSSSLPPFRTMAQIHAANKVLNEAYLLRELGAKRRGSRAGPADIVHLGLLDAGQARKWIGGGKRSFSADMRFDDLASPSLARNGVAQQSLAAVSLPTMLELSTGSSHPHAKDSHRKLAAEMALPLVVLPADVLAREIEHDQMLEQWEDDLKRRRAEAAVLSLAAVAANGSGGGGGGGAVTQRQRRKRSTNRIDDGSPTLSGMAFFSHGGKKPWLLADPGLALGGVGVGVEEEDPDSDAAVLQPVVGLAKEGSGPVRIAGAGSDGLDTEGGKRHAGREGGDQDGAGVSDEDEDGSEGSTEKNDDDDDEDEDGDEQTDERDSASASASDDDEDEDEDEGFFSFSLSLSDDEDGQLKGGRRKKDPKPKKAPIPKPSLPQHDANGTNNAAPPALGVLVRRTKSSGSSQRKADQRAAVQESALVRADAEARSSQRQGLYVPSASASAVGSSGVEVRAVPFELGSGRGEVRAGAGLDVRVRAGVDDGGGGVEVEMDRAANASASAGAGGMRDTATATATATAIRFIVEAKVLRKLKKGDVFIDYAGI